jgi:cell division protein FtsI/penicillin-binding protein 2
MHRRQALSLLLASPLSLRHYLDPTLGCALLLDLRTQKLIATNGNPQSAQLLLPPGSTLKPFTLTALLRTDHLRPDAEFFCPRTLTLQGRSFDCVHPRTPDPIRIDTALAYSCNCFVAHAAARLEPGELSRLLRPFALYPQPCEGERQQMQSIGEFGIAVTPEALLRAYAQLSARTEPPILAGLEGAVEFGTAQLARISWAKLAGKTGSTHTAKQFVGWFAAFLPGQVAVAVMLSGKHGGSDAAPVAAQILNAWHASQS